MRMQLVVLLILIWCARLFSSCTSLRNEVDPSLLGEADTKLVVSSFLSPQDTTLAVKVTRSNTVVGDSLSLLETGNNVTDAVVTLSDGTTSVILTYNNVPPGDTSTYYSISAQRLPIVVGKTYTLTVVTPNGQQVSSTCSIPEAVQPTAILRDTSTQRQAVRVEWKDPANVTNYYQVNGILRYIAANCRACQNETYSILSFDDDFRGLRSDVGYEGQSIVSGRAYLTSESTPDFYGIYKTASVTINLMTVDEAYYRFQEAIIRQCRSRNNPFAEPVLIPSNIDGGLGCFAGYNNATMTLVLK